MNNTVSKLKNSLDGYKAVYTTSRKDHRAEQYRIETTQMNHREKNE